MMGWRETVLVLAIGALANADSRFSFPEVVREQNSRIVSGWEAEPGQIPYQLSMRMISPAGNVNACGATIIHREWGLTAAHCTATRVSFVIRAGTVNLTRPGAIFETTKYYNHPLYNEAIPGVVQAHDIGLLEFGRALIFNDLIQPIRIQRSSDMDRNYEDVQLIASGWGRTWSEGSSPENLNWVYLLGTTNEECSRWYGGSAIIQPSTTCAKYYNVTSQSTCQGDSGGLLAVVDDDGIMTQVGVTSFVSITGCHTEFPAGFIRPGYYHDWFTQVSGYDFDWEYEAPSTEAATTEAATTEAATTEAATTEAATTEAATTEAATTEAATTEAATTEATTTEAATTEAASTESEESTETDEEDEE